MRARHCRGPLSSALVITLLLASLLSIISAQTGGHSSDIVENKISPSADVYAFGEYSRSQLKFDISGIPFGSNIISAKLWLYRFAADNWGGDITVYRVDDQLWGENITVSEFDTQIFTYGENHTGKFVSHGWDYLDVENQLNVDYEAGHIYSSYRLRWANDNGSEPSVGIDDNRFLVIGSRLDNLCIFFNSKEFKGKDPYLEVTYALLYGVSASISPRENSGPPGGTLDYTVTVKNTGGLADNYTLTIENTQPWSHVLDVDTFINVPPGENRQTTLSVTIPAGAENCTRDNITVTAISQADNAVRDNASCIAHATAAPTPPPPPGDNTPPPTPSLLSPANGENLNDNTPTLDWSAVSDNSPPVLYYAAVSDKPAFPYENRNSGWITADQWDVSPPLPDGIWYWRVRAKDNAGNVGENSVMRSFRIDTIKPQAPTLLSPTNGANMTDNTPPLDWSDVSDPSGVTYDLSIARDAGFVSIALQKTGLTASAYELTSAEALAAGTYRWRARAVDGAGNVGSWSENWSFTMSIAPPPPGDNTPPPTPSLVSPANGANITDNTPLLDWSDVSDPSGVTYNLSIARDAGFVSIVLQKTGLTVSVYDELIPAEALAAGTYYWRVRAVDGAGNVGSWSENRSFTVSTAPSPPVSVEVPLITAIALLVVAMIAAVALYLIKRRKRHISGPRHGTLRRNFG